MIVQMYNAILIHRTMSLYTATITKVLLEVANQNKRYKPSNLFRYSNIYILKGDANTVLYYINVRSGADPGFQKRGGC